MEREPGPITVVLRRSVPDGRQEELSRIVSAANDAARRFPGHRGVVSIPPGGHDDSWTILFSFDSLSALRAWESSKERVQMVSAADALGSRASAVELSGLEAFFRGRQPARWKMALVTWIVAVPTVQTLGYAALRIDLPPLVRGIVTTTVMVSVMTWVLMPLATKLVARWLLR